MASKVVIAYAGTLGDMEYFEESLAESKPKPGLRGAVQTYRNVNVDWSTRTGFYIIHAAKIFKEQYPSLVASLEINIWGNIFPGNQKLVSEFGVGDIIKIDGFVSHDESTKRLQQADYALIPLESKLGNQIPIHIPGKLYEYLKLEKKLLVLAEESDCKDIAEQSGLAVFARPDDPKNIADVLKELVENPPELVANKDYIKQFSYEVIGQRMAEVFKSL